MFGSSMLDIAIGLVFTFLLISVFATVINELIVSLLALRGRFLLRGIKSLLNDSTAIGLARDIYEHGQIYGLYEGGFAPDKTVRNLPSYIPAKNFALALMDVVLKGQPDPDTGNQKAAVNAPIALAPPQLPVDGQLAIAPVNAQAAIVDQIILVSQDFRDAAAALARDPATAKVGKPLVAMIDMAGGDAAKLQQSIETWFNSAMDRVSGWYKAHTQWTLFWLGILLAVVMNADTIHIVRQLSSDQTLRQSIVAAAQTAKSPQSTAGQDVKVQIAGANDALKNIHNLGLPLGWTFTDEELCKEPQSTEKQPQESKPAPQCKALQATLKSPVPLVLQSQFSAAIQRIWDYPGMLIGWLLTAIAISLGAPFWFDALNKIMVIRSTVKPAEKSPLEASKS
jgi:hypothetical protein